jgi:lipopolysaccharide transport system permease protein
LGLLGIGIGIMISAWTTKYHDLRNLVTFGLSLLMYATPVVYPVSSIPIRWKLLFQLNPVTPVIEMFRYSLFGKGSLDVKMWIYSLVASIVLFFLGLVIFNYNEQTFVDVV